ncbi:hypothetical protein EYF80_036040 [Liparis tanakae]|uniref:Uncharacterized protein n=1 Tax=Liparis tanakae TaxID=230148 RepID=A0A4Z2GKJ5_9TELE|nr:hypothetical protein EYF80_036040 [Liparis tanakae]
MTFDLSCETLRRCRSFSEWGAEPASIFTQTTSTCAFSRSSVTKSSLLMTGPPDFSRQPFSFQFFTQQVNPSELSEDELSGALALLGGAASSSFFGAGRSRFLPRATQPTGSGPRRGSGGAGSKLWEAEGATTKEERLSGSGPRTIVTHGRDVDLLDQRSHTGTNDLQDFTPHSHDQTFCEISELETERPL